MKHNRVPALVVGCLLLLPGLGLLAGGGLLATAYAFDRDDGYFSATVPRLETPTAAVTAEDLDLVTDPGSPDWVLDRLDADVRLDVTGPAEGSVLFVGIGPATEVEAYLSGVVHDQVVSTSNTTPTYRRTDGELAAAPPGEQTFWVESASGAGTQRIDWAATSGRWTVVLMNADGSAGVAAEATVGAKAGFVLPLALVLVGLGVATTAVAALLIVLGTSGRRTPSPQAVPRQGGSVASSPGSNGTPVVMSAVLDPGLSRWLWLVKWFLALPHLVVLAFLWAVFVVLTVVAGFTILFTGSYPRAIFDFNVGVLRWSWRVGYYATSGAWAPTATRPSASPSSPTTPPTLDVAYPGPLSRGLVLVKWLLGFPHYVIVAILVGGCAGLVHRQRRAGAAHRGRRPPRTAGARCRCGAAGHRPVPTSPLRRDRRPQPVDLPGAHVRSADDRRVPAVPPRPGG